MAHLFEDTSLIGKLGESVGCCLFLWLLADSRISTTIDLVLLSSPIHTLGAFYTLYRTSDFFSLPSFEEVSTEDASLWDTATSYVATKKSRAYRAAIREDRCDRTGICDDEGPHVLSNRTVMARCH